MKVWIACTEDIGLSWVSTTKGVVEGRLDKLGSMSIDCLHGKSVVDAVSVRRNADYGSYCEG